MKTNVENCFNIPHVAEFIFIFKSPGSALGRVCPAFAEECVLPLEAVVGASMIDAHAGALGMLACKDARFSSTSLCRNFCGCSVSDVPVTCNDQVFNLQCSPTLKVGVQSGLPAWADLRHVELSHGAQRGGEVRTR